MIRKLLLPLLVALALALAAAGARSGAAAETPHVVADIRPVHALAARVMQGAGAPALLLPPGADAHGFALRPSDARALGAADLVLWVGPELTPWLGRALETLAPAAIQLALIGTEGVVTRPRRHAAAFEADADHDHPGTADPHVWLDPLNAAAMAHAIAEALAVRDPGRAKLYRANAAAAAGEYATLDAALRAQLAPVEARNFAVYHDAFQYFEARYGLNAIGALADSDATSPGAARVAALGSALRTSDARCLFAEPQQAGPLARQMAEETGTRLALLDPMGDALPPGPELYPQMMRDLATAVVTCLSAR